MSPPSTSESSPVTDHARWFAEEVHPHDARLRAYVHSSFPCVRDVDDVVQESFLRIWKARAAHPIASVGAFLFRIARNVALDALRERRDSPVESVGELGALSVCDEAADVRRAVSHTERMQLLIAAIDSLPARCREIVILRKFKCVPQKEVAVRLGISEKGVEIQVTRGVKRCEEFLRRRGIRSFFGDET